MYRYAAALLLALLLGPGAWADFDPANPPQGVFDDSYYAIELLGHKCGYARMATKREGDVIHSLNYMSVQVSRGDVPLTIVVKSVHRETVQGEPLGFEAEQYTGLTTIQYTGQIHQGQLTITTQQGQQQTVRTYPWDPQAELAWRSYLTLHKRGLHVGDEFSLLAYDVLVRPDRPIPTHIKVLAEETVDLLGSQVPAFRVESTADLGTKLTVTSWLRADGVPLITTMNLHFISLRLLRCPKEYALQDRSPPELLASMLLRPDRPIDSRNAKRIVYRLSLTQGVDAFDLPTTQMQRVVHRSADSIDLEVRRIGQEPLGAATTRPAPAELQRCLAATVYIKHDDPVIQQMAADGAGGESDPMRLAERLCRYVAREVRTKDFSIGFATASEVARSRQGDCSEHAVLLAALLRARGIPSRLVAGIVHVDRGVLGQEDFFGYHMWTQAYLAGRWVDLDPALNQSDCDPTHIALDISDLDESSLTDMALRLLPMIGQLKMQVLQVE